MAHPFRRLLVLLTSLLPFWGTAQNAAEASEPKENPYPGLRNQAFAMLPEQLELDQLAGNAVYGVIMDWNMGDVVVTVVSYATGDASIYMSTGQAFIGGFAHESVTRVAKEFVAIGQQYTQDASPKESTAPPPPGKVGYYLLTASGRTYLEDDFAQIENNTSPWLDLFEASNRVITAYRLLAK